MSLQAESNLEDKYWIEKDGLSFEFYPKLGQIITFSEAGLLKAIHTIGKVGLNVDWTTVNGRSFLLECGIEQNYRDYYLGINRLIGLMNSVGKVEKQNILLNNRDNNTGKSLSLNYIRLAIIRLRKDVKAKKKTRSDIPKFFNRYNIEDDDVRRSRGGDILLVGTKSSTTMIDEGKEALERLFKKGKLIKLTREEYETKMEEYS